MGMSVKVNQFYAKNQFTIKNEETGEWFFQSYGSTIVKVHKGKVTLGKNWNYSKTTSKYRKKFLGETTKETQAKLNSGKYLYDENL
jgi:hypothetical protein